MRSERQIISKGILIGCHYERGLHCNSPPVSVIYTCIHVYMKWAQVKQEYERAWGKLFNPLNSRHNFCLPFQSKKAPQRIPFTTAKFVRRHSLVPACLNSILLSTWVTNVLNSAVRCVARCFGHAVTSVIILAFTQVHVCFFIMQPSLYSGFLAF